MRVYDEDGCQQHGSPCTAMKQRSENRGCAFADIKALSPSHACRDSEAELSQVQWLRKVGESGIIAFH
jgi:hypothetical protein